MNLIFWGCFGVGLVVFLPLFGIVWLVSIGILFFVFCLGAFTVLHWKNGPVMDKYYEGEGSMVQPSRPGLAKVVSRLQPVPNYKLDRRLTGSQLIDESLQEILGYIIRDQIEPWYDRVSAHPQFPHQVRSTAQQVIVNFSNRVKDVDWIHYLTTKLVDDVASHLRLYRQARVRLKRPPVAYNPSHSRQASGSKFDTKPGGKDTSPMHSSSVLSAHHLQPGPNKHQSPTQSLGSSTSVSSLTGVTPASPAVPVDLETAFFDLEVTMEDNLLCRDLVCTESDHEKQYLRDIAEILLFILLPEEDFHCKPLRLLVRELFVEAIILPLLDLFSDPDYINQTIIWLCRDMPMSSDVFMTVLRVTDNLDELHATSELLSKDIAQVRSRDSGGEDDIWVKQQLSSLLYVSKVIESRLSRLQEGAETDSVGLPSNVDWSKYLAPGANNKLFSLPLDVVLKNNIALSYFIDYMTSIGTQAYLFFYLNVEGWRVSAEHQISDMELQKLSSQSSNSNLDSNNSITLDNMKEAAYSIYEQYLSEKASPRLKLDETVVKHLLFRIRTEMVNETWFDDVQANVLEKLQNEEKFLPSFRRSTGYVKLLAELDLLKETWSRSDDDDLDFPVSADEMSLSDNVSLSSLDAIDASQACGPVVESSQLAAELSQLNAKQALLQSLATNDIKKPLSVVFTLTAEITETGLFNDRGKVYGIYRVVVCKNYESDHQEKWHVLRRYSDFYDLHQKIKEKYVDLAKLTFPGKKTFHNMDRAVLEKRMRMLNSYLQIIVQPGVVSSHIGLLQLLVSFFEPAEYDKGETGGQISRTFDTLVNPLKSSVRTVGQAVRSMPDNLLSTVDGVMDGLSKVFQTKPNPSKIDEESMKVGASIDQETDDNIPLRIILLLMDEVFDLKSRNQWLRRRIVTLLRQIIRTMFGDIVNRRIVDYVAVMTSPEQVADYLRAFKHAFWPSGMKAEPRQARDEATRMRTRVAAKVALLCSLSDEFKHVIGNETMRRGLLRVFEMFQHPVLNRRLLYVFLEGFLETLFPQHNLDCTFRKLHSRSSRVRDDFKTSHRFKQDLIR
ncbi:sorting nexin-13 [Frankliniella occidentalis]|uniref:Sorting nexin-13 n=1 Tax=Frankliniella occidentalis TaxID=133901 RepID=A0A6J1SGF1_FRAOC|nr:sorting nexin-13 [Frankliniella occidentalis]